ncbi:stage III sporulation protein AF [Clostridium sp.]|uniref:stage III sporulation protein AF n=1 Tax=Clostridium sp. TaxID=1506 RepID=UPI002848CFDF|nr:stage III sporulation protein AF [Clostridium sp.]MDR3596780.1 stage III sporulation protein AF [Clostridium sp.]
MFIETLKNIVITLVTVLIFISAVEIMTPNNKMKKYIKFALGLILISVILNPIIQFISNGQKGIADNIKSYEDIFSKDESKSKFDSVSTLNSNDKQDNKKQIFINNFNKNCESLLENKFKDMTFKSQLDCDVDFNNLTLNIKKLRIGVSDNKIKKIKKIVVGSGTNNTKEENMDYSEIINYLSSEVDVSKEKIEVYQLEE